jgi:peptidyl-prolyl cis-trans isomerase C
MIRRSLVLMVIFIACLPIMRSAGQSKPDVKVVATAPAAADDVIVRLLGETITEKQILSTINQLAARAQQAQQATPQQLQQKDVFFYKDALETLIGSVLLKNEGKAKNIVADKAKIDGTYQSLKGQFPNEDAFQKAMQGQGLTEPEVRKSIEDNLIIQTVLEPVLQAIPATTDADIQKFYDENPKYFEGTDQAHAAHIFMRVDKAATPEQKAGIKQKLEGVRGDIENKKITFAEAAAKYSDDSKSSQTGGDLGVLRRGDLVLPLETAIFSAKAGTLTPVVETEFGFHVISVIEVKPASKTPLAQVKPNIQQFLDQKAKQDATKIYIDGLKAKTKIETLVSDEEWNKRHVIK